MANYPKCAAPLQQGSKVCLQVVLQGENAEMYSKQMQDYQLNMVECQTCSRKLIETCSNSIRIHLPCDQSRTRPGRSGQVPPKATELKLTMSDMSGTVAFIISPIPNSTVRLSGPHWWKQIDLQTDREKPLNDHPESCDHQVPSAMFRTIHYLSVSNPWAKTWIEDAIKYVDKSCKNTGVATNMYRNEANEPGDSHRWWSLWFPTS